MTQTGAAAGRGGTPLRLFAILTTTLFAAASLAAFASPAAAVGWCTEATDELQNTDCRHFVCWGRSTGYQYGYYYERCQLSEDDLPDPCQPCCICDPWHGLLA